MQSCLPTVEFTVLLLEFGVSWLRFGLAGGGYSDFEIPWPRVPLLEASTFGLGGNSETPKPIWGWFHILCDKDHGRRKYPHPRTVDSTKFESQRYRNWQPSTQVSSVFFGGSRPIHYLHAYAKTYANLRGLRGCLREHKSASRCLHECLRGQMLSSSVEVHCGSSSWKIATFQYKCSFGSSGSKIRIAVQVRRSICPRIWLPEKVYVPKMP